MQFEVIKFFKIHLSYSDGGIELLYSERGVAVNILILYYSGVGNTKMVATKIFHELQGSHEATLVSIEDLSTDITIADYDSLVIGFPTIHAAPAYPILTFIKQMEQLENSIQAFLFATCGLYSANTLRIFAKQCEKKNMITILSRSYRCAATDGILLAPAMRIWSRHEKRLDKKVENDVSVFIRRCNDPVVADIPRFKIYSILNYPNKFFGQRFSPPIYTHKQHCVLCGKCGIHCPVQCICKDDEGYPLFDNEKCIHCYRCIHHCPKKALSLTKKRPLLKTLNDGWNWSSGDRK